MLAEIVAALRKAYGKPAPLPSDPWALILRENAAYLVDDARRDETWAALKARVGTSPDALLSAADGALEAAIADGGMRPPMRAAKLRECAVIAMEIGLPELRRLSREGGPAARKALKRFPGVGDPGADRILLAAGSAITLAPDSNALRVLVRIGFAKESPSYAATYRAVAEAVAPELKKKTRAFLVEAHQLLRRHGQETCRRTAPLCESCPVAGLCAFAR